MYGGTVFINGGTFSEGKNGSGAFVMGTDSDTNVAQASIYGGSFDVAGQAGFSVYQYANVTFGKEGDSNDKITVKGLAAGLTVETTPNGDAPTVTINAGKFSSTSTENDGSGVWYGNGSAKLTITGSQFTGTSKSGLYFDENSWNNAEQKGIVHVLGGVFDRVPVSKGLGLYYINGAIGADSTGYNSGLGHEIQITDIIDRSDKRKIYFSTSQTMPGDNEWEYEKLVEEYYGVDRNSQKLNQTTCKCYYVKVST